MLLKVGEVQKSKCQCEDHYKHGKVVEHTHGTSGVSATKSERKSVCISARCHTNTRRAKALVAKEETTRFTRGLSSRISLLLKSFFSLYMVALALVCIFGGTWTLLYVWAYGCMDVWMYGATSTLFVFLGLFDALC
jgi:hypothetical protein